MCKRMEFGVSKIVKGQVWFVREAEEVTTAQRNNQYIPINGSRPWLVINVDGIMVTCVPLTTNTSGVDRKDSCIIFKNPLSDVESKIVIYQITTKGINDFEKYLYTFDEESFNYILNAVKECVFGSPQTFIRNKHIEEPEQSQEEKNEEPKVFMPNETILQTVERRLKGDREKGEQLFRTPAEAQAYLDEWGVKSVKLVARYFNVSEAVIYNWRRTAKMKVQTENIIKK